MGAIWNGTKEKATDRKVTYTITQLITYLIGVLQFIWNRKSAINVNVYAIQSIIDK